jgi:hypothetical protein
MKLSSLFLLLIVLSSSLAHSQNPRPLLYQPLSPTSAQPGSAGFTLTVNGTGFVSGSVVNWNGSARTTTFVSASQVEATITAADLATPRTIMVTVVNPAPGGGVSNAVLLPITYPFTTVAALQNDFPVNTLEMNSVVIADFNGDGILDLAFANPCGDTYPCPNNGVVAVLLGNGDGTFQAPLTTPAGAVTFGLVLADFNGDGKPDLAVINGCGTNGWNCGSLDGNVTIFLGKGDGTFTIGNSYTLGIFPDQGVTADFNGDGKLDLAIVNSNDDTVSILLGNGDGTFAAPVPYPCVASPAGIVAGDFNRDGKVDLAITNTPYPTGPNALNILLGNGDGTFQAPLGSEPGENFMTAAVADLDHDGNLDLVIPAVSDNEVKIFLGRGDGTFQPPISYGSNTYPSQVVITDYNGDGNLDLVVASDNSSSIGILLGNGGLAFQIPVSLPTDFRPIVLALGDFNSDGRIDIATANENSVTTTVLMQQTVFLSTNKMSFPTTLVGASAASQTVTITNDGNAALDISSVTTSGSNSGDFLVNNQCGSSLARGASCNISVTFKPTGINSRTASLVITDSGPGSPQTVALQGNGTFIQASPAGLRFGTVSVGQTGGPLNATLTNTGSAKANITSFTIGGNNSSDFSQTNTCGSSIAAGASCTVSVTFAPRNAGQMKAAVEVRTQEGPALINLVGTGK